MGKFDQKVKEYFATNNTSGDIGIEIEMETTSPLNFEPFVEHWNFENDGSLRGFGTEFVLKKPIPIKSVKTVMDKTRSSLKDHGVEIVDTVRAGIHIHINMQKYKLKDVLKFLTCYYAMETALTNYCGRGRQGNLFCLRARDAAYAISLLESAVQAEDFYMLQTNQLRYSAMNLQSLFSFGSLEFRALATTPNLEKVEEVVEILSRIRDYSTKIDDCWDNISMISGMGPYEWIRGIIGEEYVNKLNYPDMEKDITTDMRNIQFLCSELSLKGI